ncbi:hypothetical protein jhhlp_006947 [Lomentospora prolificans]|uniref:Uncharacterized protein n=1 Tax=Lomentospora prolificans TaxID=41688 RepID=A0A2N3N363_9PEZI|nr:hypothetical protein jhhlp_006947 [Lomentospora prolificans]
MAKEWAIGTGILFATTTMARMATLGKRWRAIIPGGVAVAVGMYNVPSFTLARAIGGIFSWYWQAVLTKPSTPLIIMASVSGLFRGTVRAVTKTHTRKGFILGEGFLSIVNLILESLQNRQA